MEFEKRDGGGAVMRMSADEARICTAALRLHKKSVLGLDHPGFMGAVAAAASECDAAERLCASAVGAGGAALSRAGAGCIATALKMFGLKTPPLDTAILRALDDTVDDMWEARMGGCMGLAARRLAPKYHGMLGRLERAHDEALRAREEGTGGGAETGKEHEKGK